MNYIFRKVGTIIITALLIMQMCVPAFAADSPAIKEQTLKASVSDDSYEVELTGTMPEGTEAKVVVDKNHFDIQLSDNYETDELNVVLTTNKDIQKISSKDEVLEFSKKKDAYEFDIEDMEFDIKEAVEEEQDIEEPVEEEPAEEDAPVAEETVKETPQEEIQQEPETDIPEETTETKEEPKEVSEEPLDEEKITSLNYKGDDFSVAVNGSFDKGTELVVKEIKSGDDYDRYLVESTEITGKTVGLDYWRVFDISLIKDGNEIEPDDTVKVSISLDKKLPDADIVHFEGSSEKAVIVDASVKGRTISFDTDSFSSYAIVSGPEPTELIQITDIDDITPAKGFYVSQIAGYFMTNVQYNVNSSRTGIKKTGLRDDPLDVASKYYFEPAADGKYYIYCFGQNGNIQYVKNANNNSLSFTETAETAFTVEIDDTGIAYIHNGDWYWNMQGGANGNGFCSYTTRNDDNSRLRIYKNQELGDDPYELTGKTYGLMCCYKGTAWKGLTEDNGALSSAAMRVLRKESDRTDIIYVPKGSDLEMFTFEWADGTNYYLKVGNKYLSLDNGQVTLSDTPTALNITIGTGNNRGKIQINSGSSYLHWNGNGFDAVSNTDTWLNFAVEKALTPEYITTYTAKKVSVSDTEAMPNGQQVIIYTRLWNNKTKKYDYYAIDHDGSLVLVNDAGDDIQWIGPAVNTMLWEFTEYYYEGTTNPNYYYEFQNTSSGKYLAPQSTDSQILSDSTIGINLTGRRNGEYYSSIMAWDDEHYTYRGLLAEDGVVKSSPITDMSDFYFAIITETEVDENLHEMQTINSENHGIKMRLVDFPTNAPQNSLLGDSSGGDVPKTVPNLLSTNLDENGYPTATKTGRSFGELFENAVDVNHLFLASTYNSSGYYEFDSTKAFAELQPNNSFKVYKELGTTDVSSRPSLKHGQFLPYNDISAGHFASLNGENLYDAVLHKLPDSDPRKYERLHKIDTPDYYFGMEIEASFVQTPNGLDNWGHDIIYNFTGDDDFWLYVDGELLIDLGGIHRALPGSVNYSTGEVKVNGQSTTLYDVFKNNYEERNPKATAEEVNAYLDDIFELNERGQYLFRDYSTHTMKIFFMERGAGASNLQMKFNLSSIKPGQIILNKQISGTQDRDYRLAEYGYQVYYQMPDEESYTLLNNIDAQSHTTVSYENNVAEVKFKRHFTPVGGSTVYDNVFFLNPSQTVIIKIPEEAIRYKIVEVGVNTQVYDEVKVNGTPLTGTPAGTNRMDFETPAVRVYERPRVVFDNHVSSTAERTMTITKKLYDTDGNAIHNDDTGFNFRLYLGNENDIDPPAAQTQPYQVKDPSGYYCTWNSSTQTFQSLGKTNWEQMSVAEKTKATFQTSPSGAISKIPADYKIEVRNLLIGTTFKVEERTKEIPAGYSFVEYERDGTSYIIHGDTVNAGTIRANESPAITVKNKRGYGITAKKIWEDSSDVVSHENIYFGMYIKGELNSVKKVNEGFAYWYYDELRNGTTLADYIVKEVKLSGEFEVIEGEVSGSFSAVPVGEVNTFTATTKQDETVTGVYKTQHEQGQISGPANNVRTDTISNSRIGLTVKKEDMEGNALSGAEFSLLENNHKAKTLVSDENGLVGKIYPNLGSTYTLEETKAPTGYQKNSADTSFSINSSGIITTADGEEIRDNVLIIQNKPFTLTVKKIGEQNVPLEGARFTLYRKTGIKDEEAVYTNLSSSATGVVAKIDQNLPAGTYYIKENSAPPEYDLLQTPTMFTLSPTGIVSVDEGTRLETAENQSSINYTIYIKNNKSMNIIPSGYEEGKSRMVLMILLFVTIVIAISLIKNDKENS